VLYWVNSYNLSRNVDKADMKFLLEVRTVQLMLHKCTKHFNLGNNEWTTDGATANFWIKIKCPEAAPL